MRTFRRSIYILLFIFTHLLFLSSCFLQFRISDQKAQKEYNNSISSFHFEKFRYLDHEIHYFENGNRESDKVLFFVHGSPGSWDAFRNFLQDETLQKNYSMIAVDRPGYGYSNFGRKEESLEIQSLVYAPLLKRLKKEGKKIILIGHSYGGPVVGKMAIDFKGMIDGVIFIAPSIDPDLEPKKWIQTPATWTIFRWMIPRAIVVSNEEILALKPQLYMIKKDWKNIDIPVIMIQGGADFLVHPDNRLFAEREMKSADLEQMYYPELDHFIPFTKPEIVKEAIMKMNQKLSR